MRGQVSVDFFFFRDGMISNTRTVRRYPSAIHTQSDHTKYSSFFFSLCKPESEFQYYPCSSLAPIIRGESAWTTRYRRQATWQTPSHTIPHLKPSQSTLTGRLSIYSVCQSPEALRPLHSSISDYPMVGLSSRWGPISKIYVAFTDDNCGSISRHHLSSSISHQIPISPAQMRVFC